jgi:hypothetical protein
MIGRWLFKYQGIEFTTYICRPSFMAVQVGRTRRNAVSGYPKAQKKSDPSFAWKN